jgi:hypothetical protein
VFILKPAEALNRVNGVMHLFDQAFSPQSHSPVQHEKRGLPSSLAALYPPATPALPALWPPHVFMERVWSGYGADMERVCRGSEGPGAGRRVQ